MLLSLEDVINAEKWRQLDNNRKAIIMECKGIDGIGCKHNGSYNPDIWFVCNDCDNDHRQLVKRQNEAMSIAKKLARMAIYRAETGLKYGDDMKSSTKICLKEAMELLQDALSQIEDIRL